MTTVARHKDRTRKRQRPAKSKGKVRPASPGASSAKPGAVAELRRRLQLNQAVFARLLPVSVRTLATLEGGAPPTDVVARRLTELNRLTRALADVMKKESLGKWLGNSRRWPRSLR
jgi:DNA-binding transcriptional regulator YiaG